MTFFDLSELPNWLLITNAISLLAVIGIVFFTASLWKNKDKRSQQDNEPDDDFRYRKDIAERSMMSQIQSGLTSASVLMAGSFALIGFAKGASAPIPTAATTQVFIGITYLCLSIFIGILNVGVISPKASREDVSMIPAINIKNAAQLYLILLGGLSIIISLFLL